MKKYGKKLVSMILVITMIVLTFPTSLFAEEMKTTADSQTATVESTFHQFTGVIFEDTNKNGQKMPMKRVMPIWRFVYSIPTTNRKRLII